jgi:hypothetical protein
MELGRGGIGVFGFGAHSFGAVGCTARCIGPRPERKP